MGIRVRGLTFATTTEEACAGHPGGISGFLLTHPSAALSGPLVRLATPVAGVCHGAWASCPGAYVVELHPHPDIAMLTGRTHKVGALVLRGTPLRKTRSAA